MARSDHIDTGSGVRHDFSTTRKTRQDGLFSRRLSHLDLQMLSEVMRDTW